MIKNREPLSMSEVSDYIKKSEGKEQEITGFIKKFAKTDIKTTKEMIPKLEGLSLMKLDREHLVKVVDLMPENKEELNKIFPGVGLDEDETKKILEIVKEFK